LAMRSVLPFLICISSVSFLVSINLPLGLENVLFYPLRSFVASRMRKLCLPELKLPDARVLPDKDLLSNLLSLTVLSSIDLGNFLFGAGTYIRDLKGKKKRTQAEGKLSELHKYYVENVIKHRENLPIDYKYFGSGDNVRNLQLFLSNNPFFASALTSGNVQNTFNLFSFDPSHAVTEIKEDMSWFMNLTSKLDNDYPRVNMVMNSKMEIISYQVYNMTGKSYIKKSVNDAAGDVLYLLSYYTECIHALIHVFHFINVAAMSTAEKEFPDMTLWTTPYLSNVAIKYEEVGVLLLADNVGVLTGKIWRTSRGAEVKAILRDMLCKWGSCKSANQFIDEFIFRSCTRGSARAAGLLPQFYKHCDLIAPFAKELTESLSEFNPGDFAKANMKLQVALQSCGHDISTVSDVKTWTELMCVTGILHGSTPSLSRHLLTEEMLKRCSKSETYTITDVALAHAVAGTIVGMIEERHVFSSSLSMEALARNVGAASFLDKLATGLLPVFVCRLLNVRTIKLPALRPAARNVLLKYDALSSKLKADYFASLKRDKDFSKDGWILTDHCPDGIDGKQLTLTSYI